MDKAFLAERWLEKEKSDTPQLYAILRWEAQSELERIGQIVTEAAIREYMIAELRKKDLIPLDEKNEPIYPPEGSSSEDDADEDSNSDPMTIPEESEEEDQSWLDPLLQEDLPLSSLYLNPPTPEKTG